MQEKRRLNREGIHFITLNVAGWIDIFTNHEYCDVLVSSLNHCIEHKHLEVYEYVLLPSQLHLIAQSRKGYLSKALLDFRAYAGKQLLKCIAENPHERRREWITRLFEQFTGRYRNDEDHHFWQFGNNPIKLPNSETMEQQAIYLRNL